MLMALLLSCLSPSASDVAQAEVGPPGPLLVHEWGTFTSVAGIDGAALDWRPLAGPSDLPSFVYTLEALGGPAASGSTPRPGLRGASRGKGDPVPVRMETPVLYFYADRPTEVSVRVDFPEGTITEWYPAAHEVGTVVDWGRILVQPPDQGALPHDGTDSHYYPARAVDADLVRVCGDAGCEYERFLFYRGVGDFQPPARFVLDGEVVRTDAAAEVILFENRGGRVGFAVGRGGGVERPVLDDDVDAVVAALEERLVAAGLFADEARAMTDTWRDSWFEEGLRALWLLPEAETDRLLPLSVEPAPTDVVRVMVGRVELFGPEERAAARRSLAEAPDAEQARAALEARHGRFAEPLVRLVLAEEADPVVRARAERVIGSGVDQTPGGAAPHPRGAN